MPSANHKPLLQSGHTTRVRSRLHIRLLNWFQKHQRDLPWRKPPRDPYRIWVSEVMLQQTTAAAVVPRFERFIAALPNLHSLANADEQQVLKLWEGLGYYRRARNLYAAARLLVQLHDGNFPQDPAVWKSLPGVGRYILGAVLSQAFDLRLPIVEANSLRVLTRLFGYPDDPRTSAGQQWLWAAAESLLPRRGVGDFNQAIMELGAIVCTPTSPDCGSCPLAANCEANRCGLQQAIPPRKQLSVITKVNELGVVIRKGAKVLLCRRPANAGRWQNMWEFPHAPVEAGETTAAAAERVAQELTGFDVKAGVQLAAIKHAVTRYSITLVCLEAAIVGGAFVPGAYTEARWVTVGELAAYPVSSPQRLLMTALAGRSVKGAISAAPRRRSRGSSPR